MRRSGRPRELPSRVGAVCGALIFTVAWAVLGFVVRGFDPAREYISGLAARETPHAEIMVAGFVAMALAEGCAAVRWSRSGLSRPTTALLGLAATATLIAGVFQQRCSTALDRCWERVRTLGDFSSTAIHGLSSSVAFLVPTVAALVAAWSLRRRAALRTWAVWSAAAGVIGAGGVIAWYARVTIGQAGTLQRVVAIALSTWVASSAWLTPEPIAVADHPLDIRAAPEGRGAERQRIGAERHAGTNGD